MSRSIEEIYLLPGDFYITDQPRRVVTILGSCVSVVMSAKRFHLGGIIHGIFPKNKGEANCDDTRYTDCAVNKLIRTFVDLGIPKLDIEVKMFGGANINVGTSNIIEPIGNKNVQIVLDILKKEQIEIKIQNVGGNRGRKILFYPHIGEVYMKYLSKTDKILLELEKNQLIKGITKYE